jgi:hypothetical protein
MTEPPVHLIEIEGTAERLRGAHGIEGVTLHPASTHEVGPTRHAVHAVATDAGIEALKGAGLDVRVVEDAEARAARFDAMARQIREAESD